MESLKDTLGALNKEVVEEVGYEVGDIGCAAGQHLWGRLKQSRSSTHQLPGCSSQSALIPTAQSKPKVPLAMTSDLTLPLDTVSFHILSDGSTRSSAQGAGLKAIWTTCLCKHGASML